MVAFQVITMSAKLSQPLDKEFQLVRPKCCVALVPLPMMAKCWNQSLLVLFTIKRRIQHGSQKLKWLASLFLDQQLSKPVTI